MIVSPNVTAYNTVLASWLFCSLGKCILPTTFVLTESFSASMPPRRQHPTVSGHHPTKEFLHKERAFFIHGPPSSKLKEVFP
jgi:hypothetical protein